MEEFLKKLQLSNEAITIYLKSLGQSYLTYNELYSFVPDIAPENFSNFVDELVGNGLLIQKIPEHPEILIHFLAIPPFQPILDYFYNINSNLSDIAKHIKELATNSLNQLFKDKKTVVMDFYKSFQEIRKDVQEDTLIQKQEAEEIVVKWENLKKIEEELAALKNQMIGSMLMEFNNLIKSVITIKTDIIGEIKNLNLKKNQGEIINIIEQEFSTKSENFRKEIPSKLPQLIEEEINKTNQTINKIVDKTFEFRDEFKALYLSVIANFELNINKFQSLIKSFKDLPKDEISNLVNLISKDFNSFVSNSLKQISVLNEPIEGIMEQFLQKIKSSEGTSITNLWFINSRTKIYEEIQNLIENSKERFYLIVPKLEDYMPIEMFKQLSKNLKVRIAASNATTDAFVNILREIRDFEYKSIQNNEIVALKGDDNHIVIGIAQNDSKDKLKNFVGFGSNFQPIVKALSPILEVKWEPDKIEIPTPYKTTIIQPILLEKERLVNHIPPKTIEQQFSPKTEVPKTVPKPVKQETQIFPQKVEPIEVKVSIQPKAGDEAGILMNNAFNALIEKVEFLNGMEFSKELEKLIDMILNSRGFSVTLHDVRRVIVQYKTRGMAFNQQEKNEILASIQNWKQKLL